MTHRAMRTLLTASTATQDILNRCLAGNEVSEKDGIILFSAPESDMPAIASVADYLRSKTNGDAVSFVVTRNINFTNICYMGCKFCNFAKRIEDVGAQWLDIDKLVERAVEAWDRGATEVCIQGGLHPKMKGTEYRNILLALKARLPDLHIHAFSPFEIWYGAKKSKLSYEAFLSDLKNCGLDSMPGTAAEILDTEIRKQLTKNKLSTEQWVEIITTAHKVGIPTTCTIMYGHIDGPKDWAGHICKLRDIQKQTGGFTEFVPLSFVHTDSPLYTENPETVRPGPTALEVEKMHAISRILLHRWIDNIQVSWTKLGAEFATEMLQSGVNDLGGTLMNESISRASGALNGQEITATEMVEMIRTVGRTPVQRNTLYQVLETYLHKEPTDYAPLVDRKGQNPLDYLAQEPMAIEQAGA